MDAIAVRPLARPDVAWAEALLARALGGRLQARRGEVVDVLALPGLVAEGPGGPLGLLAYRLVPGEAELAAIAAEHPQRGVGTALVDALVEVAAGRARIWVTTTNDNLEALRFYQRRGFTLHVLRPAAVDDARRRLKPTIPEVGAWGIPLRDELELELHLR